MIRIVSSIGFVIALAAGLLYASSESLFHPQSSLAATDVHSVRSGQWSAGSTWSGGRVPGAGDTVTIEKGHTVTYDVSSNDALGQVNIKGTLRFSRTKSTRLKLDDRNIQVHSGGFLDMGTADDFIPRGVTAEIIFVLPPGKEFEGNDHHGHAINMSNDTGLWAMSGSRWEVHGAPLVRTWSELAQNAAAGARTVIVENDVTDWYPGGTVVVTMTNTPSDRFEGPWQNETRVISSLRKLSGGRTEITLDKPLSYSHEGTKPYQGEVGLLTRNVRIQTEVPGLSESQVANDNSKRRFAHTVFMKGSSGDVQYGEFKYMGHYLAVGRYPIHTHQMGESSRGMVIRGNGIWYTGFRWVNIHSSYGITIEDNVGFSALATGYFTESDIPNFGEPGAEALDTPRDIAWIHNLGVEASSPCNEQCLEDQFADYNRMGTFWPLGSIGEAHLGNVAAGTRGGRNTSGFSFSEGSPGGMGGQIGEVFIKNEAHSGGEHGVFTWTNRKVFLEIVDSLVWRNGANGFDLGAYIGDINIYNARSLQNRELQVASTIVRVFLQDSLVVGRDASQDRGQSINAYFKPHFPDEPHWIVRNTFRDLAVGYTHLHDPCEEGSSTELSVAGSDRGDCGPDYSYLMGVRFENVRTPIDFGWHSNANSWHKVAESTGMDPSLPESFYLNRRDQLGGRMVGPQSRMIIGDGRNTEHYEPFDALLTPTDNDWTNYPPEISLDVSYNGKVATIRATATDDKDVPMVEFYVDWTKVATKQGPPYEVTVDLSRHPRKYAYLYAKAYDKTSMYTTLLVEKGERIPYIQRAYSNVVEVGPEFLLGNVAPATISASRVSPTSERVEVPLGGSQTFTVRAEDSAGKLSRIEWFVNGGNPRETDPISGSSAQGSFTHTFASPDSSVVEARVYNTDGDSRSVSWTVVPPPTLKTIAISPASATAQPGGTVQFTAAGLDQAGAPIALPALVWSVSGGGTISSTGLFTAGSQEGGPFTVTARAGIISGTASVSVRNQLISNITADSDASYERGRLAVGQLVYIDREYTFTQVPADYVGLEYIRTANEDKNATDASFLTFTLTGDATVYVAYDARAETLPAWLSQGWTETGHLIDNTDAPRRVYRSNFPAGLVTLGGNAVAPMSGAGSNYSVLAGAPAGGTTPTNKAPQVDAGPDLTITLPGSATLHGTVSDDGLPNPPRLVTITWSKVGGPGQVTFADASVLNTTATFSLPGSYVLRLTAHDSSLSASDQLTVTVRTAAGAASLTVDNVEGAPGSQVPVGVSLDTGGRAARSVQLNLGYPGALLVSPSVERGAQLPGQWAFVYDVAAPGDLRIVAHDPSGAGQAISGQLVKVTFTIVPDAAGGEAPIQIPLADVRDASNAAMVTTISEGSVTVMGQVHGDADGDGRVTSADVNIMIDWLIGQKPMPGSGTPGFVAADVNGDRAINSADVNLIVDRLLGRIDRFPVEE